MALDHCQGGSLNLDVAIREPGEQYRHAGIGALRFCREEPGRQLHGGQSVLLDPHLDRGLECRENLRSRRALCIGQRREVTEGERDVRDVVACQERDQRADALGELVGGRPSASTSAR